MLPAELRGKALPEVQSSEDYLTSAVFEHLRYIQPSVFWQDLFSQAKTVDNQRSLDATLDEGHLNISRFEKLSVFFWRYHPKYGEPDLVLRFSSGDGPSVFVIVEAKLYSGKSGTGEDDQLVRYLRLLAHLEDMDLGAAKRDIRFLVYLTPRDSTREIKESLDFIRAENDPQNFQNRIFSLQWQDILETAQRVAGSAEDPTKMILTDVAKFLKQRKLEYFVGFDLAGNLDGIEGIDGAFYGSKLSGGSVFTGMARFQSLSWFAISSGEWM